MCAPLSVRPGGIVVLFLLEIHEFELEIEIPSTVSISD